MLYSLVGFAGIQMLWFPQYGPEKRLLGMDEIIKTLMIPHGRLWKSGNVEK